METIKQLLQKANVKIADEQIVKAIETLGMNPDELSEDEAVTIAETIIEQTASKKLAIAGKKTRKGRMTRKTRLDETPHADNGMATGLAKASAASSSEITSIAEVLDNATWQAAEVEAEAMVAIVRSLPNRALHLVGEKAAEEVADTAHFRNVAEGISEALFSFVGADAAE